MSYFESKRLTLLRLFYSVRFVFDLQRPSNFLSLSLSLSLSLFVITILIHQYVGMLPEAGCFVPEI